MRTVTFSDAKVAAALSKDFISAWKNIRPEKEFRKGVNDTLDQILARNPKRNPLSEGTGATNICSIFALPDGRIVHAVQGYMAPSKFLVEIAFALEAAKAARETNPADALKSLYERRLKNLEEEREAVRVPVAQLALSPLPSIHDLPESKSAGLK